jgi:hypothetical protein
MITAKIDRGREHDRAAAGCFREAGEEIVSGNNRRAMLDRAQKLLEVFAAQWPSMFLFAKHDRVVEIENDPAIGALKKTKLEFIETDRLEQNDDVMPARFAQNA